MTYKETIAQLFSSKEPPILCFADTLGARARALGLPIAIYGMGENGVLMLSFFRERRVDVAYLSDMYRTGTVDGMDILTPQALAERTGGKVLLAVTVSAIIRDEDARAEFSALCAGLGINAVEYIPRVYMAAVYYRGLYEGYGNALEPAQAVIDMMDDGLSRYTYCEWLRCVVTGGRFRPPFLPIEEQYIARELFELDSDDYVIDCGAYNGDTVEYFAMHCPRMRGITAFEPTPQLLEKVRAVAGRVSVPVEALGKAVGACEGVSSFGFYGSELGANHLVGGSDMASGHCAYGSALNDADIIRLDVCTLDRTVADRRPTYIKMDIEGGEISALRGCESIIRGESPPILAICLYHSIRDSYRIPALIKGFNPRYKMFVRKYGVGFHELVLYAVPPHRLKR